MEKKEVIFLIIIIIFFSALFVRGCIMEKRDFEERASGILLKLEKAGRSSYRFELYDPGSKSITAYIWGYVDNFNTLRAGDSIIKENRSFYLNVYRKKNGTYQFIDSFEFSH